VTAAVTSAASPPSTPAQRWLARLSFALAGLAIVIVLVFAGIKSIGMLVVGLVAAAVTLGAAYFFLSQRGILRWLSLAVFVLAPIAVIVVYAFKDLLWVAIVAAVAWLLASMTARLALTADQPDWRMPERPAEPPPRHPYLIMNPKSGGGKVEKFDLKRKAEDLGAEVFLLGGPEHVDVADVARAAVASGADLLGVAGGDGTQALVAGIAAEHGLPFLVISAGTRNHFALDLGLDREDPSACLGALRDGVELRVDLGVINGQTFVNNASFGAYAEIVESPAYRDDKRDTTLTCCTATAGPGFPRRRTARGSRRRRRCWWPTTRTEPGTSPGWAGAYGWIAACSAWSASRSAAPGRRPGCSAAGRPPG